MEIKISETFGSFSQSSGSVGTSKYVYYTITVFNEGELKKKRCVQNQIMLSNDETNALFEVVTDYTNLINQRNE